MKKIFSTLATLLCLFAALNAQTTYYWNGTTTSGTGAVVGGSGTWTTAAGTTNWLTATSGGAYKAWPNTNSYIADFTSTGTPATVTMTTSVSYTANSANFTANNYTLTLSSNSTTSVTSNISISPGVGLNLMPGNTGTLYFNGNITGAGSNGITINESAVTSYMELEMETANTSISVPINTTTNNTYAGGLNIDLVSKAAGVQFTGPITMTGTVGEGRVGLGCTSGNALTITGQISGTSDLQYSSGSTGGAGTITLTNTNNNFTGNLYMVGATSGDFQVSNGAGACVPSTMGVYYATASEGGLFDINGSNVSIAALSQTSGTAVGGVTNNGAPATLTVTESSPNSFGLVISNGSVAHTLALTQAGTSTLTLTGVNTYTGATNVNSGTLFVNSPGSLASGSAVTVGASGTLGGNGTVNGTVAVNGTIAPGSAANTAGTLTTGAQTWTAGAVYDVYIGAATGTAGTNWDLLASTGAVTLPASGNITLNVTNAAGSGWSNTSGYVWKIMGATGFSNFNASNFTINPTGFTGYTGTFSVVQASATEIDLVYVPSGTATLLASPATLSGFITSSGTASPSQSYGLLGYNLTNGGTITVTAPSGYQVSLDNINFFNSVNPTYSGTTLNPTTIYVQLAAADNAGTYNQNVGNTGGGYASTLNVALTGVVETAPPTVQATNVVFSAVTSTGFTVNWTNGNSAYNTRIAVIRLTSTTNVAPVIGTTYTANAAWGSGSTTGAGNYVIFNGASGPVTVTGLTAGLSYTVEVYEYNGTTGNQSYLTTTATGNPASQLTNPAYLWWNGANPGGTTANGGTGNWNTANAWVSGTYSSNTGTAATWADNSNAVIAGTPGTGLITQSAIVNPDSVIVKSSGYTLSQGYNVNSYLYMGQGINLAINPGEYTIGINGASQYWTTTGGSLTLTNNQATLANWGALELANTGAITLPLTITNQGAAALGIITPSGGVAAISGNVTFNASAGAGDIFLEGSGAGSILTISGNITGTGNILVANSPTAYGSKGALVLSGNNSFTGDIHMAANSTAGLFQLNSSNALPSTSGFYYTQSGEGGLFDLHGFNTTIAALGGVSGDGGSITNSGASGTNTLTVNQSIDTSFNLAITDGANAKTAFTFGGTGILTLKGTPSTYTGPTNVTGGSLFINGSGSLAAGSAVTVSAGAIFGGSSTAAGTLSLSGTLSPGATGAGFVGTFTTGAETWNSGAGYYFDITNVAGTAGTNWDLLTSTGNVDLSAGNYTITVNGASLTGFSNITNYTWKIISAASFSGFNASNFTINPVNFPTYSGTFKVTQPSGTEVDLVYVPSGGLAVNPSSLSGFTTTTGTPSASQSYVLSGDILDGTNIVITAPTGYEVSLDNSTFSPSLTITNGSGNYAAPTLGNTTIYVRIAATAAPQSPLTGNITNVGGNAPNVNVSLTGTVYSIAPTTQATNVTFSSVNYNSFTVNWTNGNGTSRIVTIWPTATDVAVAPANNANYTANTVFGSGSTTGGGNYVVYNGSGTGPVTITGLALNTNYAVKVYEYNGGTSVEAYDISDGTGNNASGIPNNATTLQGTYYWNGGSPSNGTNLTANGGTGTWNTTGTNYSWVEPVTPGGNGVAWTNGTNPAIIAGTAGTITQGANITAGSITVQVDGYTLQNGNATQTITSPIYIGNSGNTAVNFTITPGTYSTEITGNIAPAAGTTGGAVTFAGTSSGGYGEIELNTGDVVSVPLTISNTGTTGFLVTTPSGGIATISNGLTLNQSAGAGDLFIDGSGAGSLITIEGLVQGTGNIAVANSPTAYGSKGILAFVPNAGGNTFTGTLKMEANTTAGYVEAGYNGISGVPATVGLSYPISGEGGIFDLYGCNVTVNSLSSISGAGGYIANGGAIGTSTLTVNQSTTTSFGLAIKDSAQAKTAFASIGSGSLTLSAINTFSGGLTVGGTGTLILTAANTFSGGITLNGGTLQCGIANAVASQAVTFNGGAFSTGSSTGYSQTLGTIQLSANSSIDLGTGVHTLNFANSSGQAWTPGTKLTIYGWTGTEGTSGTSGRVYFGNNTSGLTNTQLQQISFNGFGDGAIILSTGEVVPANNYTWTGTTSTAWNVGTNWNRNSVPTGCQDNIYVPVTTNSPSLTTGAVNVGNVTIDANATLSIATGSSLSVCGAWQGGTGSNATITGAGAIILNNTTGAQTLTGYTQFSLLTVDNSNGVAVNGNVSVTKALVNQKGNITNNGTVTIMSTASGDAYYDDFSNGTAGSFIGNMVVQRYVSNTNEGYRDISSPVSGTVADMTSPQSLFGLNGVKCWFAYNPYPNLQVYNETETIVSGAYYEGWLSYTGTSNPLTPMKGLAFRTYVGNPYTISFTGAPYTGNQSIPITKTPPATRTAEGWNFVGNPYPSSVSWNAFKSGNPGVTASSYYVFNTTAEYAGNWGAWNGTAGTNGATDNIAMGQGFFVSASGDASINMTNSMRTTTPGTFFGTNHLLDNEVRLVLSGAGNSDEIVSYTDPDATSGYDPNYDALKIPAGSTVDISFALSGMYYAINVMDSLTANSVLPLNITVTDTGTYTLTATTLNIPGLKAYLSDAQTGTLTDLSANNPTLTLNGSQTYSGRYSVVFKAEPVSGISQLNDQTSRIYSYGNTVYVQRSSLNRATVTVTDILGREVTEVPTSGELTTIQLNGPEEWYAIVKVTEGDNVSVTKVLISNK